MSLIRCTQLLSRKNNSFLNVFKPSTVHYSDDKKSSDDGAPNEVNEKPNKTVKKSAKKANNQAQSFSPESQNRLNELLKKLSSRSAMKIVTEVQGSKPLGYRNLRKKQNIDAKEQKPRNVTHAAKAVSAELGEEKVEDEILAPFGEQNGSDFLDDVISKMKTTAKPKDQRSKTPIVGAFTADKKPVEFPSRRRNPIADTVAREIQKIEHPTIRTNVTDVFSGKPIGIFQSSDTLESKANTLKTWEKLERHELRLRMSNPPRNYFEKMAYWTEEGKVWHFPIDNEQGLDTERETPFTEHIFLEEQLEPWCPKKGAVRNFMELVCIGLSKNPYLSVQEKREHIEWYRNYFHEKRDVLQRVIQETNVKTAQVSDGIKSE